MKRLIGVVCAVGLAACSGDQGPAGPQGNPGMNGQNGTNGMDGMNGNDVIISARAKHGLDISPVPVDTTGLTGDQVEKIGQGSYLVNAIGGCADCHNSPDQPPKFLAGGTPFPLDDQGHVVYSRNLTNTHLMEDEFVEVIHTGKDFSAAGNPQALIVMPWIAYRWMGENDIRAIYAYLKAIPAVTNQVPADNKGSLLSQLAPFTYDGTYTNVAGINNVTLPAEKDGMGNAIPDPDYTARGLAMQLFPFATFDANQQALIGRGSYLVNSVAGCPECHSNVGQNNARFLDPGTPATFFRLDPSNYLNGGQVFGAPPQAAPFLHVVRSMSADLVGTTDGFFKNVDFSTFLLTITLGTHADDPPPQMPLAWPMPWDKFRNMELGDLEAVYTYMKAVQQLGGITDKPVQMAAPYCSMTSDCDTAHSESCDSNTHECTNRTCPNGVSDCYACQTCVSGHCVTPSATDACVVGGI